MQRCSKGAASLSYHICTAAAHQRNPSLQIGHLSRSIHSDLDQKYGLYEALGVDRKATKHQIKHAFRQVIYGIQSTASPESVHNMKIDSAGFNGHCFVLSPDLITL